MEIDLFHASWWLKACLALLAIHGISTLILAHTASRWLLQPALLVLPPLIGLLFTVLGLRELMGWLAYDSRVTRELLASGLAMNQLPLIAGLLASLALGALLVVWGEPRHSAALWPWFFIPLVGSSLLLEIVATSQTLARLTPAWLPLNLSLAGAIACLVAFAIQLCRAHLAGASTVSSRSTRTLWPWSFLVALVPLWLFTTQLAELGTP